MKKLSRLMAETSCALMNATPAVATVETPEARELAASAADQARQDMVERFGVDSLKPNQYKWDVTGTAPGEVSVVVSLSDQMAYAYRDGMLVGAASVSTARDGMVTPTGIFPILQKKPMHHSRKYDNAPMPFMQRLDDYGIAMHAGHNPGYAASHGCIRLPNGFCQTL